MEKLYKIERDEKDVCYDEYIGFIICASNEEECLHIALEKVDGWNPFFDAKISIIGVPNKGIKKGILFESFNAG